MALFWPGPQGLALNYNVQLQCVPPIAVVVIFMSHCLANSHIV